MKRSAFTILSASSLLLCVAITSMWVRSYWYRDGILLRNNIGFASDRGSIWWRYDLVVQANVGWFSTKAGSYSPWHNFEKYASSSWHFAGIGFARFTFPAGGPSPITIWAVPHWSLAAIALVPPALWLLRWRRLRHSQKACANCGYDLRASIGCCPECGIPIPASHYPAMNLTGKTIGGRQSPESG